MSAVSLVTGKGLQSWRFITRPSCVRGRTLRPPAPDPTCRSAAFQGGPSPSLPGSVTFSLRYTFLLWRPSSLAAGKSQPAPTVCRLHHHHSSGPPHPGISIAGGFFTIRTWKPINKGQQRFPTARLAGLVVSMQKFSIIETICVLFLILEKMGGRGRHLICWKNSE